MTGIVADNNGAVVPAVKVVLTNEKTGETRSVTTQANGSYTVPLLLPGSYRVEFSVTGFKQAVKSGLQINVTETARFDVQLEVGGVQEQITIASKLRCCKPNRVRLGV
ncbi:MAG: carboxypeptidase regulatory-like domain-containing protein [Acidobacteria bacterium]|nr:carboxypeptidase regulatory-like domain-containing protein [Acidobacteriota bacterium]